MIKVYIDYGTATEYIATFMNEALYLACWNHLNAFATMAGGEIVESYQESGDSNEQCN